MSVVAESARHSEPPPFYPAGAASPPAYGLPGSAWPPFDAAGGSNAAQPAMHPATAGSWRESRGGADLMSVVAESSRRFEPPQFHAPGTASPMAGAWGGSAGQSGNPFEFAVTMPAEAGPSSGSRFNQQRQSSRLSQGEFGKVSSLVQAGLSTATALSRIGRSDVAKNTIRRNLSKAGVESRSVGGRTRSLSAAQIEAALSAQADYISRTGLQKGSIKAAYEALGSSAGKWATFRAYFSKDGLSDYGRRILADARGLEERTRQAEQMQSDLPSTVSPMGGSSARHSSIPSGAGVPEPEGGR